MKPQKISVINIKLDNITPEEMQAEYPHLWSTCKQLLPNLSNEDIAKTFDIMRNVCPDCFESPRNECFCMRDD